MCAPPGQGPEEAPTAMSEDFRVKVIGRKWKIKQKAGLGMLTICNMDGWRVFTFPKVKVGR